MKKGLVLAGILAIMLAGASGAMAGDGFGVYMGLGGSYAFELFDVNQYNRHYTDQYGLEPEFDNTYGFYAVIGGRIPVPEKARVARMFSFELEGNYIPGFEFSGYSPRPGFKNVKIDMEMDVTTITGAIKFDPKFGDVEVFRPYALLGGGLMIGQMDTTASTGKYSVSGGDTEHDPCIKGGLGFDYYLTESISLNMEGTYVYGWHDLDEIRYVNTTLGFNFHM